MHVAGGEILAIVVGVVGVGTQRDVSPTAVETTVVLQFSAEALVAGIAHGGVATTVDELSILVESLQAIF